MTRDITAGRWRGLGWLLLILVVLSWPIRFAQQVGFGQVVLYTGLLRLALFATIFATGVLTASRETNRDQVKIIALGYLVVSLLAYNLMVVTFGAFYTAFGFNLFIIPSAIALIFFVNAGKFQLRGEFRERGIIHLLLCVAVPISLFGIIQFALNDQILHTGAEIGPASEYGSAGQAVIRLTQLASTQRIRANSIFGSAIEFGHFATLFSIVSLAMVLKYWRQVGSVVAYASLTGLFMAAVVSTNTRNMLLFLVCSTFGCVLLWAGLGRRALVAAALGLIAVFYATVYGTVALAPGFFAGFLDTVSLLQRARGVYVTVEQYIVNADSLMHILFGYGYMQSVDFTFLPTTVFDNTELDVFLYSGVVGVVLFVALLLALFLFAVRQWQATRSPAWLAAASLLFATPLFSTMNIDLDEPCFVFIFALVTAGAVISAGGKEVGPSVAAEPRHARAEII